MRGMQAGNANKTNAPKLGIDPCFLSLSWGRSRATPLWRLVTDPRHHSEGLQAGIIVPLCRRRPDRLVAAQKRAPPAHSEWREADI